MSYVLKDVRPVAARKLYPELRFEAPTPEDAKKIGYQAIVDVIAPDFAFRTRRGAFAVVGPDRAFSLREKLEDNFGPNLFSASGKPRKEKPKADLQYAAKDSLETVAAHAKAGTTPTQEQFQAAGEALVHVAGKIVEAIQPAVEAVAKVVTELVDKNPGLLLPEYKHPKTGEILPRPQAGQVWQEVGAAGNPRIIEVLRVELDPTKIAESRIVVRNTLTLKESNVRAAAFNGKSRGYTFLR